uniref:FERM adjacent (FA) domain-containing protein n=1 Tax=Dendroctonus ponderosae TaxID=77166 RepID=A0AAR5PY67_DENPD
MNSPGIFTFSGSCNRELSPVRWCDREVDGVYLGKSGWVQVQQRSLEDSRKASYSINVAKSLQSRRTGLKLANYHFYSEPNKFSDYSRANSVESQGDNRPEPKVEPARRELHSEPRPVPQRPAALQLQTRKFTSPPPEPGSPPSITPIISPPLAFQDKNRSPSKSRTFFGKAPFLPRSNAIEDSDNSPPTSPLGGGHWVTTAPNAPVLTKPVIKTSPGVQKPPRTFKKVPQTKSLEDTTASRRMQFKHQYGSSSSSSSSMGFRSLDSCLNRTSSVMPKLVENADSSVDVCGDADEEDNNSSSANMNMINPNLLQAEFNRKLSPSGRSNRLTHYRNQPRRSPSGSEARTSPASSSSSSNEFLSRSPPTPQHATVIRRNLPNRPFQSSKPVQAQAQNDSLSRVRRSRSLQLPERSSPRTELREQELLREAEVVTGFLYGNRSRAAAQALLMHRYNNNNISLEEKNKEANKPALKDELTVYYVGNSRNERQRVLLRGATSPSLPSSKSSFEHTLKSFEGKAACSPEICDFWPHCVHRDSTGRESHFVMRSSQSYPSSHQRSSESLATTDSSRSTGTVIEKKSQYQFKRRNEMEGRSRKPQELRRISPSQPPATGSSMRRNGSTEMPAIDRKNSPRTSNVSGSSSGSDVWLSASRASSRKGSQASTPVDSHPEIPRNVMARPESAPMQDLPSGQLVAQQRSMSLPKSFLTSSGATVCTNGLCLQ